MYRIEVYDADWNLIRVERCGSAVAAARFCEHHARQGHAVTCRPAIPLDERRAAHEWMGDRDAARR